MLGIPLALVDPPGCRWVFARLSMEFGAWNIKWSCTSGAVWIRPMHTTKMLEATATFTIGAGPYPAG